MGDVYKARDTRLDRTVAIKVIRTDFSERFEREAKSISALNHPNICTLHDVGHQDGTAYLVMEFVDGAPIAGPLPLAEVLKYGVQICDALDAAHRKSIVHRDLKPANILATKSGIKLLDFGLAKLQPAAPNAPGNEATVAALTGAHTIVGTPQYMAPEQIEGHDADERTDIFALGCVLYELITGQRAFDGKTASSVMAAILATEPRKITELAPITPPSLEWVVSRCLEKEPDARWQSARDVALQLKRIADHPTEGAAGTFQPAATSRRALLIGLAAGASIAAIAAALWNWTGQGNTPSVPSQVSLIAQLPDKTELHFEGRGPSIDLSPDGRTIAFGAADDRPAIYLRPIDSFEAVKIAGTEEGSTPVFSPSGKWIAFAADGRLKKIAVEGGAPIEICSIASLRGATWLDEDTVVLTAAPTGPLMRVSAHAGATPTALTKLDATQNEKTHRSPAALPGGKAVLFVVGSNEIGTYDEARIVALQIDTGQITELVRGGHSPAYLPSGHLLFVRDDGLFAMAFDPATLKTSGTPVLVLKDVATLPAYGAAQYAVAPNEAGGLIYVIGGDQTEKVSINRVDRTGKLERIAAPERSYVDIQMSRDGKRLALIQTGANNVLWSYDLTTGQTKRLTHRFDAESPVWTPDSTRVTYWSGSEVRTVVADGNGADEVLIPAASIGSGAVLPQSWSPDGQWLSVEVSGAGKGYDVGLYSVRDKKLTTPFANRFDEYGSHISPDGKWLAFISEESTRPEVYVRAMDGSGGKVPVTNDGKDFVLWSAYGRELIVAGDNGIAAVAFTPGATPVLGKPAPLFGNAAKGSLDHVRGAVPAPDGASFIVLLATPMKPLTEISVVTNWAQTLAKVR